MEETQVQTVSKAPTKAMFICLIIAWIFFLIPFPFLGIIGLVLNFAAFILSIICMAKGKTGKGILGLILSIIVSAIIYFIGLAIFASIIAQHINQIHHP